MLVPVPDGGFSLYPYPEEPEVHARRAIEPSMTGKTRSYEYEELRNSVSSVAMAMATRDRRVAVKVPSRREVHPRRLEVLRRLTRWYWY